MTDPTTPTEVTLISIDSSIPVTHPLWCVAHATDRRCAHSEVLLDNWLNPLRGDIPGDIVHLGATERLRLRLDDVQIDVAHIRVDEVIPEPMRRGVREPVLAATQGIGESSLRIVVTATDRDNVAVDFHVSIEDLDRVIGSLTRMRSFIAADDAPEYDLPLTNPAGTTVNQ